MYNTHEGRSMVSVPANRPVCVCVCLKMYVNMKEYVCMYACMYTHRQVNQYASEPPCVCVYVCVRTRACVLMSVRIPVVTNIRVIREIQV